MVKKTPAKKEILVNFILDRSGSMQVIQESTIKGFNEYLNTLKKDGNKYRFTLTLFDTTVAIPYLDQPIEKVKELTKETYGPDGWTALYDAVCSTVNKIKEKKDQKVITIIMTDGQENSSEEYNQEAMKALIQEKEKKGNWTFVYLGANQDSYAQAQQYGFSKMNTSNYSASARGMNSAMSVLAANTVSFTNCAASATMDFFSADDQTDLESGKVSQHFSNLGKKSWEVRKNKIINS